MSDPMTVRMVVMNADDLAALIREAVKAELAAQTKITVKTHIDLAEHVARVTGWSPDPAPSAHDDRFGHL